MYQVWIVSDDWPGPGTCGWEMIGFFDDPEEARLAAKDYSNEWKVVQVSIVSSGVPNEQTH